MEWNTVSSIHPSHNILFVSLRGHLNTFIDFIIFIYGEKIDGATELSK